MDETATPTRNFFISIADHIRAAQGPPAYSRRKRRIEDLEASLFAAAVEAVEQHGGEAAARRALDELQVVARELREVNRLIVAHNLYYPVEANLRLDPVTRRELDRGKPWQPLPTVTLDDVLRRACAEVGAGEVRETETRRARGLRE